MRGWLSYVAKAQTATQQIDAYKQLKRQLLNQYFGQFLWRCWKPCCTANIDPHPKSLSQEGRGTSIRLPFSRSGRRGWGMRASDRKNVRTIVKLLRYPNS